MIEILLAWIAVGLYVACAFGAMASGMQSRERVLASKHSEKRLRT